MACANVYTGYLDNQFDNFDDQKDEVRAQLISIGAFSSNGICVSVEVL